MNLLPLDAFHRQYLSIKQAIEVDLNGNETLAGLSWQESLLYLCVVEETMRNELPNDLNSLSVFLSMHERHTALLPDSPWITEALIALNEKPIIRRVA